MLRSTLLLASLVALAACDRAATTDPTVRAPSGASVATARQGMRGILRRVLNESPDAEWRLEVADGSMLRLVGGPLDLYRSLENTEVFVVGSVGGGDIVVDSLEEDTRIYREFMRRR